MSAAETKASLCRLLEARYLDGAASYTDFYPIAQIRWILDNIGVFAVNDAYTHFTLATITDYDHDICEGFLSLIWAVSPLGRYLDTAVTRP